MICDVVKKGVAMQRLYLPLLLVLFVGSNLFVQNAVAQFQTVLRAGDGGAGFGSSVFISGERVLVGESGDHDAGMWAGAAYVFERQQDDAWVEVDKFFASDAEAEDRFGSAVALDGDRALIVASGDDDEGDNAGAAYIFEYLATGIWMEVAKITVPGGHIRPSFADKGIGLSGSHALIGDPDADSRGDYTGAAYLFEQQTDGTWLQTATLTASDGAAFDFFGLEVAIDGETAIVGARHHDDNAGAAYVFERQTDGSWLEMQKLQGNDTEAGDQLGVSVSISGDRVFVGSDGDRDAGFETGSVYVFERTPNGSWIQDAKLIAGDQFGNNEFGGDVAVSGDRAFIGARDDPSVYSFVRLPGGAWVEEAKMINPFNALTGMGAIVSISGTLAVTTSHDGQVPVVLVYDVSDIPPFVSTFFLINTDTDLAISRQIPDGTLFDLSLLPRHLSLQAYASRPVESVRFEYTDNQGRQRSRIESVAPYALFGDVDGDYSPGTFPLGELTITATPYTMDYAGGEAGEPVVISINIIQSNDGPVISTFYLVDAEADEDIMQLSNGTTLDLSALPSTLNIRADVRGPATSVHFSLEPQGHARVEKVVPYALFGDLEGDYFSGTLSAGTQTLSATAFRKPDAAGDSGPANSIELNIISSANVGRAGSDVNPAFAGLELTELPDEVALHPAFPNPFNNTTTLNFSLPKSATLRLIVYDVLGREVKRLVDGMIEAGHHEVVFDAGDLPSGIYLYYLETPEGNFTRQMILLK